MPEGRAADLISEDCGKLRAHEEEKMNPVRRMRTLILAGMFATVGYCAAG
jgi:hypothetical protein